MSKPNLTTTIQRDRPRAWFARATEMFATWLQLNSRVVHKRSPESRLSRRDLLNLLTMLMMLVKNGLSLQRALEALASDRACRRYHSLLIALRMKVSAGCTLSQAMSGFPKVFSHAMVHQIALAESSGTLLSSLENICEHLRETLDLRRQLVQKLSYPGLVSVAGAGLVAFMLISVVPQFEAIYSESEVALPWVTRFVTSLSRAATRSLWILPVILLATFVIHRSIRSRDQSSERLDRMLLKLPVLGTLIQDINALDYLRSTLILSEAGFVPLDALSQASRNVPNRYVRKLLVQAAQEIRRGQRISQALAPCEFLFPNSVLQLIAIGEQTGGLTVACRGAVELIKQRMQNRLQAALGILEPTLTILLATCIGWIVLAIYMPMFHMFDVLDF